VKQSFVNVPNKNNKIKSKPVLKETVNDTIADFGFLGKEEPKSSGLEKLQMKENKIMVNKHHSAKERLPKKLKIK